MTKFFDELERPTLQPSRERYGEQQFEQGDYLGGALNFLNRGFGALDEALPPSLYQWTGKPEYEVPAAELPPIPDGNRPEFDTLMQDIFGEKGERLDASWTEMQSTAEGQQANQKLMAYVSADPDFAPQFQEIISRTSDPEAAMMEATETWKTARRADIGYGELAGTARVLGEAAITFAPEIGGAARLIRAGVPAGKALSTAARSAVHPATVTPLAKVGAATAKGLTRAAVVYPYQAARAILSINPKVGSKIVAAEEKLFGPLQAYRAKRAAKVADEIAKNPLTYMGRDTPLDELLMAETGDRGMGLLGRGLLGGGAGYLAGEGEGALAGAFLGAALPPAGRALGKTHLPLSHKAFQETIGTSPIWGATAGAMAGSTLDFMFGDDDEYGLGGAMGAVAGAVGGPAMKSLLSRKAPMGMWSSTPMSLTTASGGKDLSVIGQALAHILPAGALEAVADMPMARAKQIADFMKAGGPGRKPATRKELQEFWATTRGLRAFQRGVRKIRRQDDLRVAEEMRHWETVQPFLGKLRAEDGEDLIDAMESVGRNPNKALVNIDDDWNFLRQKGLDEIYERNPRVREAVAPMRKFLDDMFQSYVDADWISARQYREGYFPKILDKSQFYQRFAEPQFQWMQSQKNMAGLKQSVLGKMRTPDGSRKPLSEADWQQLGAEDVDWPEGVARDHVAFFGDPEVPVAVHRQYFKSLAEGDIDLGLTAAELKYLKKMSDEADTFGVNPGTVFNILAGKNVDALEQTGLFGARIPLEEFPEGLLYGALKDRVKEGTALPFIRDPATALFSMISRESRKRHLEPLIKGKLAADLGTPGARGLRAGDQRELGVSEAKEYANAMLAPYAKTFEEFPGYGKILKKMTMSRLGYPSKTEIWLDDITRAFWPHAPGQAAEYSRILRDLQYTGALGFKPASALRNSFQSLLTATSLDGKTVAEGMVELERNREFWMAKAKKAGALRDFVQAMRYMDIDSPLQISSIAAQNGTGKVQRFIRRTTEMSLSMFQDADTRNRSIAFVSAYRRMMIDKKGMDLSALRKPARDRIDSLIAQDASWDAVAELTGKEYADLTQWVYGKTGSPLISQGPIGGQMMMFTSWPMNYISLLKHWAASGDTSKILNLALGGSLLDMAGREMAGVTRLTGLTTSGSQDPMLPVGLPTGPMPRMAVGGPLGQAAFSTAGLISAAIRQDPRDIAQAEHDVKYNLLTSTGFFAAGSRVAKALEQDNGLIRMLGFIPPREGN